MAYRRTRVIVTAKKKKITGGGKLEPKNEHDLQKLCVAHLRAHNMICSCTDVFNAISFIRDIAGKSIYKQHMIKMGGSVGFPDLIIIHDGKCTFVEFKFKKGKKSPDQELWTKILTEQGYEVLEWRELQQCTDWIVQQLKERENQ